MPPRLLLPCTLLFAAALGAAQEDFVPLFPDDSLENWHLENTQAANFSLQDGVLRVQGEAGWLRSPEAYADFVLRLQFRFVTEDADSGIFLRAEPGTDFIRGWPGDSYQVQIREISVNQSDRPLPLVNLYRHSVPEGETAYARERVFELYEGVGQWHDLEIRAAGDSLRVFLQGEEVLEAGGLVNASGSIGFQSEAGIIEYRDVRIDVQ